MAQLKDLVTRIVVDDSKGTAGLDRFNDSVKRTERGVTGAFGGMESSISRLGPVIATALSVETVRQFYQGTIVAADEMAKMAQRVGVSVEALSALQYAGELADVPIEKLGVGLKQLSKNMLDASAGLQEPKAAFAALGISVTDAGGKMRAADSVFADVSEIFSNMPDGVEKTALAMKLFGKAGADMIPLLNEGRDGLREMREEAEKLGVVLSTEMTKNAEDFNDNLTRLKLSSRGLGYSLANEMLPYLNSLSESLVGMRKSSGIKDFTKDLLEFDQTALNMLSGPTRGLLNKILPKSMEIQPFEFVAPEAPQIPGSQKHPVKNDALSNYLAAINKGSAENALAKIEALNAKLKEQTVKATGDVLGLIDLQAARYAKEGADRVTLEKWVASEKDKIFDDAMRKAFKRLGEQSKKRGEAINEELKALNSAKIDSLAMAGEYVAAEKLRQQSTRTSIEYRTLAAKAAADVQHQTVEWIGTVIDGAGKVHEFTGQYVKDIQGVSNASQMLTALQTRDTVATVEAHNKEAAAVRNLADETKVLQAAYDDLIGKTNPLKQYQDALNDGLQSAVVLEERLAVATFAKNSVAINGLKQEISLQQQMNEKLQQTLSFQEQVKTLTGEIVGFSNGTPIYRDDWRSQYQYQSPSVVAAAQLATNASSSSFYTPFDLGIKFLNLNDPFRANGGPVSAGTPYIVGERGVEIFIPRQNGSIVPNSNVSGIGGVSSASPITVNIGVTIRERGSLCSLCSWR